MSKDIPRPDATDPWRPRHPLALDAAAAVLMTLGLLFFTVALGAPIEFALFLDAVAIAGLAWWRRRQPHRSAVAAGLAVLAHGRPSATETSPLPSAQGPNEDIPRLEAAYTWFRRHPFEVDAAAAAITVLGVLFIAAIDADTLAWVPIVGMVGALAWRRQRPLRSAVAIAVFGSLVLLSADSTFLLVAALAAFCSLYALTAYGPRWAGWAGAVVAWFAGAVMLIQQGMITYGTDAGFAFTFMTTVLFGIWALGRMRRLRLRDEARLEERARLLESEAEQQVALAATAERARIAREMHDVVAHSLSVTISQADGGRYAAQHNPEAAVTALETIAATGRQALADMRALLGVLRDDSTQQLTPQPDTEAIKDLIEQVRNSGLEVTLEVLGDPIILPAGPGLAAYRIVQESLTNVLKHGGPNATAWVRLAWLSEALEIRVEDDGRGAAATPASPGSQGLIGMRERATLYGGQLEAGPRQGGGFGVRAYLPYGQRS